jgi:hypothetical protein
MNSHIKTNYEVETNFIFNYGHSLNYEDRNFGDTRYSNWPLKGTPKQIAWAEDIRKTILEKCADHSIKRYLITEFTNALFWINVRKMIFKKIFQLPQFIKNINEEILDMKEKAEAILKINDQKKIENLDKYDAIMRRREVLIEILDDVYNGKF